MATLYPRGEYDSNEGESGMTTNEDLRNWLDVATKGLPKDTAQTVRAELEAHYTDAFNEHEKRGESAADAHTAAMAELGDPKATAAGLHISHLSVRRYVIAAVASTAFLLAIVLNADLWKIGVSIDLLNPIRDLLLVGVPLCLIYVFRTFQGLLNERFGFRGADRSVTLLCCGLGLNILWFGYAYVQPPFDHQTAVGYALVFSLMIGIYVILANDWHLCDDKYRLDPAWSATGQARRSSVWSADAAASVGLCQRNWHCPVRSPVRHDLALQPG
jgi:hypothetical protein